MRPISLSMPSGGRRSLRSPRPPLSDSAAALTQRVAVIVPPRPREARKPANLEDPGVRSTPGRSFSSRARRTAVKTNIRSSIHSGFTQAQDGEWRDCVIKHKRAAAKPRQTRGERKKKKNSILSSSREVLKLQGTLTQVPLTGSETHWTLDEVIKRRSRGMKSPVVHRHSPRSGIIFGNNHIPSALGDAEHQIRLTALPLLLSDPKFYWHVRLSRGGGGGG